MIAPDRTNITINGKDYPIVGMPALMPRGVFRKAKSLSDKVNKCEGNKALFAIEHVQESIDFAEEMLRFALGDSVMDELEPELDRMSHLDFSALGFSVLEKYKAMGDEVEKILRKASVEEVKQEQ